MFLKPQTLWLHFVVAFKIDNCWISSKHIQKRFQIRQCDGFCLRAALWFSRGQTFSPLLLPSVASCTPVYFPSRRSHEEVKCKGVGNREGSRRRGWGGVVCKRRWRKEECRNNSCLCIAAVYTTVQPWIVPVLWLRRYSRARGWE